MLHRTYRPQTLSEVCGQEQTLITLRAQIAENRFSSAYLFEGHRGTGKTSIARILARTICCDHPTTDGPCNHCRNCRMILEEKTMDFIELDAASHNTIADIKELINSTSYLPSILPKKIYIIDEAHNLSKNAFDALLKTIEEPPEHCIFMLCTTELYKIPVTIRSRCSIFTFSALSIQTISGRLATVLDDVGKKYELKALETIAYQADGSMRDALSICDRLILSCDILTYTHVKNTLKLMDESITLQIIKCIISKDTKTGITYLKKIYEEGNNLSQLAENIIHTLAESIILKSFNASEESQNPATMNSELYMITKDISIELIFWYTDQFCGLKEKIRNTLDPYMDTLLAFVKCCNPDMLDDDKIYLLNRINKLEDKIKDLYEKLSVYENRIEHESSEIAIERSETNGIESDDFEKVGDEEIPFRGEAEESRSESGTEKLEGDEGDNAKDIFSELLETMFTG